MAKQPEIKITYRGHEIVTTTHREDVSFYIESGPLVDGDTSYTVERRFESTALAKAAVDKYLIAVERAKKVEMNVSLPVINHDGTEAIITGVHAGHGAVTGKDLASNAGYNDVVYPRADWIGAVITERKQLHARIATIDAQLRKIGIDRKRKRYGKVEPGEHTKMVERLLSEYAEMKAIADLGPPKVPASETR